MAPQSFTEESYDVSLPRPFPASSNASRYKMRIPRNYHDDDLLNFCVYALRRSDCMAIIHYINDTVQVCSPKVRTFAYPPHMSLPCGPVCISWQQQQRAKSKGTGPGYPRGKSGLDGTTW